MSDVPERVCKMIKVRLLDVETRSLSVTVRVVWVA